jgi:hypothetical protein
MNDIFLKLVRQSTAPQITPEQLTTIANQVTSHVGSSSGVLDCGHFTDDVEGIIKIDLGGF